MTWEETIRFIRKDKAYKELVENAYFEENLSLNIERFAKSEEFIKTLDILKNEAQPVHKILDIGCGNGISAINFALNGYDVTAVEPDPSETIGAGAIQKSKEEYSLKNISIIEDFAENIAFKSNSFDVVYIRQAMHHANDLMKFIAECVRVLKPGGLLLTIRDHVVFDEKDKQWFLAEHPLHKFYGGENAFSPQEYTHAIEKAGAVVEKELKYFESVINYFPVTEQELLNYKTREIASQKKKLQRKTGMLSKLPFLWDLYVLLSGYKPLDEKKIPGRMYSYIARKK